MNRFSRSFTFGCIDSSEETIENFVVKGLVDCNEVFFLCFFVRVTKFLREVPIVSENDDAL